MDLVSGDYGVPDNAITASSYYDASTSPDKARINNVQDLYNNQNLDNDLIDDLLGNAGAWSPRGNEKQWIQVISQF